MDKVENLIKKLEQSGLEKVKDKLRHDHYLSWKIPYVEDWIEKKEQPTVMYHEVHAPKGKTFKALDCTKLKKNGWVDTPAKFGTGFRSKARKIRNKIVPFLAKEWKWLLGFIVAIIGLLIAYYKS